MTLPEYHTMPSIRTSPALEALADLKIPKDIRISPDGQRVVYALESFSRVGQYAVSSLWIADVGVDHSARQVTSGLFRDERPQWSPDGKAIAFVSDRTSKGKPSVLYLLPINGLGGEAYPLTDSQNTKSIASFEWSPDGTHIAFLSEDESEDVDVEDADPVVYGSDEDRNQRLRLVSVEKRTVRTVTPEYRHVEYFSWSPNATEIAYSVPDTGAQHTNHIDIVSVNTAAAASRKFITFKGPINSLVWALPDALHLIGRASPPYTSPSVYEARIKSKQWGSWFGWDGEAVALHRASNSVVVRIQNADHEAVHALGVPSMAWPFPSFFKSEYEITSFDSFRKPASDDFTLVVARSSPQMANEVWSVACTESNGQGGFVKLSSHNSAFDGFRSKRISSTVADGWECDGWLFTPRLATLSARLPTVVLTQGPPLHRANLRSFSAGNHLDVAQLTTSGYAVLYPTPRNSGGYGEEYLDVIAVIKKAVAENLVDESRVIISGWSDGGFLSSLAVIRNDFTFQAVVCGGGVVNWDFVNANSDQHWPQPNIPGDTQWDVEEHVKVDASAPFSVAQKRKQTPLLIFHGREDEEVPVSQPLAFWRERRQWKGHVQMVLYPREKHVIRERKHLIDMWTRALQFYDQSLT